MLKSITFQKKLLYSTLSNVKTHPEAQVISRAWILHTEKSSQLKVIHHKEVGVKADRVWTTHYYRLCTDNMVLTMSNTKTLTTDEVFILFV